MRIAHQMNEKKGKVGVKVRSPPYSKIVKTIDKFKNSCIFPETDIDIFRYSQLEQVVFRSVYQPYQELLLLKNAVDFGDLI
jgi:superfamily I DNA/RNA helicase